jgi:hypothetical protein
VSPTNHCGEIRRQRHCLLAGKAIDFDLEVSRHQLAQHDASVEEPGGEREARPPGDTRLVILGAFMPSASMARAAKVTR